MAERIPQNTSIRVPLHAVLSSDHASPATGKTIAITISKNGAAFANPAAGATNATEIASGAYYVDLTASDANTLGPLVILGTAASTDNVVALYDVVLAASIPNYDVATLAMPQTGFSSPVDIANRACQHIGAKRIDAAQGFSEDSVQAGEISFCYSKLRRAELQRNVWTFATRRAALRPIDTSTMLLAPTLWSASVTYFLGSVVADDSGYLWISRIPNNANNDPQNTSYWEPYFGPLTVTPYVSTTGYRSGELVYVTAGAGLVKVFMSMVDDNTDDPSVATAWSATATYMKNQVVTESSVAYMSRIDLNTNQDPASTYVAEWASGTTYASGAKVTGSDGTVYQSSTAGNVGHDPTTDGGVHWTNTGLPSIWDITFVGGSGSLNWLEIGGSDFPYGVGLSEIRIIWPAGTGPASTSVTRNVYRLPSGYLRRAPQNPSAGRSSWLGAPGNLQKNDWEYQDAFLTTMDSGVIMFRFVADVTDVARMDDMFCEGLACRVALEVCEPVTQSTAKLGEVAKIYQKFMGEARTANAIEQGSEGAPLDDFIACRI